jgi:hypothetical protein
VPIARWLNDVVWCWARPEFRQIQIFNLTLCGQNFFWQNLPWGRLPDISDSSVSFYRENNELILIKFFSVSRTRKEIFGLGSPWWGPPQTQVSEIRCPLLQLLFFSLEYASQMKSIDFFMQRITEIFSLWQVWWFFELCDLDLLTLMLKVKFLCIKWKLTCLSITCQNFLLIQPQLNFWWFFKFRNWCFLGLKKKLRPGEKCCFTGYIRQPPAKG